VEHVVAFSPPFLFFPGLHRMFSYSGLGGRAVSLLLLLFIILPSVSQAYTWEPLVCFNMSEAEDYLAAACQLEAACRFESTGLRDWHTLLDTDLKVFTTNPLLDARENFEPDAWRGCRPLVNLDGATHCDVPDTNTAVPMVVALIVGLIVKQTHYVLEEGRCDVNWVPVLLPVSKNITCTCAPGKACVATDPVGVFFVAIACVLLFIAVALAMYSIWLGRRMGHLLYQPVVGEEEDETELTRV
jgi:hypothetical protein